MKQRVTAEGIDWTRVQGNERDRLEAAARETGIMRGHVDNTKGENRVVLPVVPVGGERCHCGTTYNNGAHFHYESIGGELFCTTAAVRGLNLAAGGRDGWNSKRGSVESVAARDTFALNVVMGDTRTAAA